ncbi:MAG: type IV secretion system protein VirB5 [Candidatus Tokpelaia sp. JSC189]|nr:MAG: type IV secretion system protein VirB5 [Candidatus Tokpelaia sp. JSC189]
MYDAVSGYRGFGDVLRNQEIAKHLPEDWEGIYDASQTGNYRDITESVNRILEQEKLPQNTDDALRNIRQREERLAATNKAMGMQAFQGVQKRLSQIEGLINQIKKAQDPKAISELQTRIAGEQAAIQNEIIKLQLMAQLQQAEKELIERQKEEIFFKDFDPSNTKMPRIK